MIDRLPIFSIVLFELGNALGRIFRAFEQADDDIFHIIGFEEGTCEINVDAVIEIADRGDSILDLSGGECALLPLMEIPADHARQARIDREACTPAILWTV